MLTDYTQLSARKLASGVNNKKFSAVSCAEALIAQAQQWEMLNAFITFRPEQILADARRIDERIANGEKLPLAGVALFIKDLINTTDYPTTSGTPALKDYQPKQNAPALQRLLDAGAIVGGKTNLDEFAYGISSNNLYTGPVRNPYNLDLIPGGSSGGTAAAIAARIGVAGLGTDTGGSVRIPAALCGITGLRTTLGRWPAAGMAPASHSRDIIGPFGRTLSDVALLDSVVVGEPVAKAMSLRGVRLGIPRTTGWTDLDPETKTVSEAALITLQKAGAELVEVDMNEIIALDQQYGFPIALFETLLDVPTYLIAGNTGVTYDELIAKIVSPQVKNVITQAPTIPLDLYKAALAGRARMLSLYAGLWEKHAIAALVFPTTPLPPRPIGQEDTVELNGRQVPTFPTFIRNTGPASTVGLPGLSIPIGMTKTGLPVGLEFDGPAWQDRNLLCLGLAAEKLFAPLPPPEPPTGSTERVQSKK
jgi:indoleacetamide hydrolase